MLCVAAVTVAPASAHQFTASALKSAFPLRVKGVGVGNQMFKFGKIELECETSTAKGTIASSPVSALKVEANFKECKVPITVWGEHVSTTAHLQVELLYSAEGLARNGFGLAEGAPNPTLEVGSGSVSIGFANTGGCKVIWPAQSIPAKPSTSYPVAALFSNEMTPAGNLKLFPSGFQQKLVIASEFKGMLYQIEEKGLCSEFSNVEKNNGRYNGQLQLEVSGGNLGFE
ncbi:MAG TPA: hypothetical protein VHU13_07670 [Solirubrobacteraceae bacterium]|nr:hypothetical protein [Solirubrobacteraceae bacterium]